MNTSAFSHKSAEPFEIIHNCRGKYLKPKRKTSLVSERTKVLPEFSMKTRKMTAELETLQEINPESGPINHEEEVLMSEPMKSEQIFDLFQNMEEGLQHAIPFDPQDLKDVAYPIQENSHSPTYSKLERALFGFVIQNNEEEMDEE